jgi:hypothetical protein
MASIFLFGPYGQSGSAATIQPGGSRHFVTGPWNWQGMTPVVSVHGWFASDTLMITDLTSYCASPPGDRYITYNVRNTGRWPTSGYSIWIGGVQV